MECGEFLKILGARIKTARKAKQLSQERLAELSGMSIVFISNLENGRRRASICSYHDIAQALDMSLSELVELPGGREPWNADMMALLQEVKSLTDSQQKMFTEIVRGALAGIKSGS